MIKYLAIAFALGGLLAGSALAQQPGPKHGPAPEASGIAAPSAAPAPAAEFAPASNPDDCLKTASDLAVLAEEKKLAEDRLDKIEELLVRMETHCDARRFTEAVVVAKDIKSLIEKQ
jgi:hypothetical protein